MPTTNRNDTATTAWVINGASFFLSTIMLGFFSWTMSCIIRMGRLPNVKEILNVTSHFIKHGIHLGSKVLRSPDFQRHFVLLASFVTNPVLRAAQAFANVEQLPSGIVRDFYLQEAILDGAMFAVAFAIPDPVVFELMGRASLSTKYLLIVPPLQLLQRVLIGIFQAGEMAWLQEGMDSRMLKDIDWNVVPILETMRLKTIPARDFANDATIQDLCKRIDGEGPQSLSQGLLQLGEQGYTQLREAQLPLAKLHLLRCVADEMEQTKEKGKSKTIRHYLTKLTT